MEALYHRLPEACRLRPLLVLEPEEWVVPVRRACYGYDTARDRCEIHLRRGIWRFPADWAHELGHLAEHWAVTYEERAAWQRDWESLAPRMPTRYGRRSPAEGFAECFVEVVLGRVPAGYAPLPWALRGRVARMVYGSGGGAR